MFGCNLAACLLHLCELVCEKTSKNLNFTLKKLHLGFSELFSILYENIGVFEKVQSNYFRISDNHPFVTILF